MNGDETFQNIKEGCFKLDIANRKRPRPQIRIMQISLPLVIPGQCRNHRNESNQDTGACCKDPCERVDARNEPAISETCQQCAQDHARRLPDQGCYPDQRTAEKHQTQGRLSLPLEEGKNTQRERKRGENLAVRAQGVTWPEGMDEHGIANSTPRPCPVVRHSRTDSPLDKGCGHDDKYREKVNRKEVVPA